MDYYNKLHHTHPDEATNKRATNKLAFEIEEAQPWPKIMK